MRYFIQLAYDGSAYKGWQRQVSAPSVQEELEKRMSALLKSSVGIWGCGRTDALVHASQFYAHFDCEKELAPNFLYKLNKILPQNIQVFSLKLVPEMAHAQFDVQDRSYDYFLHTKPDVFISKYSSYYDLPNLNIEDIQKATSLLSNYDNYRAFCKSPDKHNHTIVKIQEAFFYAYEEKTRFRFHIRADRFLKGMIRILVWHLLEIGKGKLQLSEFEEMLKTQQRDSEVKLAYPQGLFLSHIRYPYLNEKQESPVFKALCNL